MKREELQYACLFGGGAIRGLAHVGVVRALKELGIGLGTLAGSSVGALAAAFLAVGYDDRELEKIFLDVDFELFRDIDFGKTVALSKGKIFLEWLREVIEAKFYGVNYVKGKNPPVRFRDIERNLVVVTTDLTNFSCREFSKHTTPDFEVAEAVRISACMPGLMRPVEVEECTLVDGDLQKSWPMWKLCETLSNLDENVLEIRLEGTVSENLASPISFINSVYSCVTSVASDFVVDIFRHDEKHDCLVVNTGDVVIVNFQMKETERKTLIQNGYEQTIEYFKNLLPVKKKKHLDNYIKIRNFVVDTREMILKDKVAAAQVKFANLLALLCEVRPAVDENIYTAIMAISPEILNNSGTTIFLKHTYLKDARKVLKKLDELEILVNSKVSAIEKFVEIVAA